MWMSEALDLDRPGDQSIDDPHDRRLARQIAQPLDIVLGAEVSLLTDGLHDLAGGAAAPEQAFEGGLDVGGHADPGQHRLAGEQLHRADRVAVERIRHGHGQASGGIGQGQNARLFQKIDADPVSGRRQIRIVRLAGERQIQQLRQYFGHLPLGDQAELRQKQVQRGVAGLADLLRAAEPGGIQPTALDQQPPECLVDGSSVVRRRRQFLRRHRPAISLADDHRPEQPDQPEGERKMRPEGDPAGPGEFTATERSGQGEGKPKRRQPSQPR